MANFKKFTRYTNGVIDVNREGVQFLVLRPALNLPPSSGDVFVQVTQDLLMRPDLVSFKAYGVPDFWWAIYELNGIRDPLFDLKLNQTLRIPSLTNLKAAIASLNT